MFRLNIFISITIYEMCVLECDSLRLYSVHCHLLPVFCQTVSLAPSIFLYFPRITLVSVDGYLKVLMSVYVCIMDDPCHVARVVIWVDH